eukprot:TRINITY_DN54737_c0_g1_i1.p1 TRINITY_DN54737_c0_g1~~TRINITY_DN54737_c0_g1_i1.p1  ORF type:complete len:572 (-),score=54.81 TRINITY_DN54737_c0_g1_i1:235-1950(-)
MPTPRATENPALYGCLPERCEDTRRRPVQAISTLPQATFIPGGDDLMLEVREQLRDVKRQLAQLALGQSELHMVVSRLKDPPRLSDASSAAPEPAFKVTAMESNEIEEKKDFSCKKIKSNLGHDRLANHSADVHQQHQISTHNGVHPEHKVLYDLFSVHEAEETVRAIATEKSANGIGMTEWILDSLMGVIISLNALYLGFSMDVSHMYPRLFVALDVFFLVCFLGELAFKISHNGFGRQFFGEGKWSNRFDAALVCVDVIQMAIMLFSSPDSELANSAGASLLRIIRVAKLARLVRLLRSRLFYDLLVMIRGLIGGMSTLGWAIIMFLVIVYVVALVFREAVGRQKIENVQEYFDSVPRSMFTIFRCSFGDCSAISGVPIFEHVHVHYGLAYSVLYCLFIFVVGIGIFNVISAMFIESTMKAATAHSIAQKKARMDDIGLWCTNMTMIILELIKASPEHEVPTGSLLNAVDEIVNIEIDRQTVSSVFFDNSVAVNCLSNLDIDPQDNARLSEVLDPDNGGTIAICDLVDGIWRLRGEPTRSDMVILDVMVRSLHMKIDKVTAMIEKRGKA